MINETNTNLVPKVSRAQNATAITKRLYARFREQQDRLYIGLDELTYRKIPIETLNFLDLDVSCSVLILASNDNNAYISIDSGSQSRQDFRITQDNEKVTISQPLPSKEHNVAITRQAHRTRNRPKRYKAGETLRLVFKIPPATHLKAKIKENGFLMSNILHNSIFLDFIGNASAQVTGDNIYISALGTGYVHCKVTQGKFRANIGGSVLCDVFGNYSEMDLSASSHGCIRSVGSVKNKYFSHQREQAQITHMGDISGSKTVIVTNCPS